MKDIFPYLDNVTVGARREKEHNATVKSFLKAICCKNFTFNDSKTVSLVDSIKVFFYLVRNNCIKPDPDQLQPPRNFPHLEQLRNFLIMSAYNVKWIDHYVDEVWPLANAKTFLIDKDSEALSSFQSLKQELENAVLYLINKSKALVECCNAQILQGGEVRYPAIEKKATAIIRSYQKVVTFVIPANIYNNN